MEKATVSKFKNNLSAYLRKVRAGQTVVIFDREMPIARLERIESSNNSRRLALMRPLSAANVRAALTAHPPSSARLLNALMEDRTEGR